MGAARCRDRGLPGSVELHCGFVRVYLCGGRSQLDRRKGSGDQEGLTGSGWRRLLPIGEWAQTSVDVDGCHCDVIVDIDRFGPRKDRSVRITLRGRGLADVDLSRARFVIGRRGDKDDESNASTSGPTISFAREPNDDFDDDDEDIDERKSLREAE